MSPDLPNPTNQPIGGSIMRKIEIRTARSEIRKTVDNHRAELLQYAVIRRGWRGGCYEYRNRTYWGYTSPDGRTVVTIHW